MADKSGVTIGQWFLGDDITLSFTAYTDTAHTACVDASSFTLSYVLRKGNADPDAALITKATGGSGITVSGTFDANPATNEQRILVAIDDTDTASLRPGEYQHALKRTDAGFETTLVYTDADTPVVLTQAAAR